MFALIDCNNFYASCERVFQPHLNGKPVVILSNNDGCVIARSNEAKSLGIPMGAPAFKYKEVFQKNKVQIFSSNFTLYGDISNRVMSIISRYVPDVEIYSIDEAFIKFDGFSEDETNEKCRDIIKTILKWTGIPVSIGLAPTKSLAKVANRIAKKYSTRTNGFYSINNNEKRIKALKNISAGNIWGIGFQNEKKLLRVNVKSGMDFVNLPDQWVKKNMSIIGLKLKKELEGIPTLNIEEGKIDKKSIATTRSFESEISSLNDLIERITTFSVVASKKLRRQNSECNMISVFIRSNPFKQNDDKYHFSLTGSLPFSTNSSIEISKFAVKLLNKIYSKNKSYKKAGIILMGLSPQSNHQFSLFDQNIDKQKKLMRSIDSIDNKYGLYKVRLASQDQKRIWKMKRQKLSRNYTTEIDEVLIVK
ncbi:MAG: Y-family DNA polymerase [Cryomorphaceae bacterium]|jgi:DNA polymerase V|nr:Y-family DNA polymerase [Cryomorphaceae bacterium]MBT3503464.1 Y-family DNA polymerase [Cryomorphaceae bacterium]MBT3688963.1 Y-family DNA polymerase [Cryomorphaceae bacterium]MBT4222357.1 Y-family DNA polymerase [Cryomorphaceae bacterium]MBT4293003.1 Y-family DNA polymerase [Cryomorphaceae bacterium]